jgi:hypothetical protein
MAVVIMHALATGPAVKYLLGVILLIVVPDISGKVLVKINAIMDIAVILVLYVELVGWGLIQA